MKIRRGAAVSIQIPGKSHPMYGRLRRHPLRVIDGKTKIAVIITAFPGEMELPTEPSFYLKGRAYLFPTEWMQERPDAAHVKKMGRIRQWFRRLTRPQARTVLPSGLLSPT